MTARERSVYVGNLADDTTEEQLLEVMQAAGPVVAVRLAWNAGTGRPLGSASVEYTSVEDAAKAMRNLNGRELLGRVLRVDHTLVAPAPAAPALVVHRLAGCRCEGACACAPGPIDLTAAEAALLAERPAMRVATLLETRPAPLDTTGARLAHWDGYTIHGVVTVGSRREKLVRRGFKIDRILALNLKPGWPGRYGVLARVAGTTRRLDGAALRPLLETLELQESVLSVDVEDLVVVDREAYTMTTYGSVEEATQAVPAAAH